MNDLKLSLVHLQCELVAERATINPQNISWLQYDILLQLENQNQLLPSELSDLLGISRTKLSKSLRDLKILGYINQLPNQLDGRERCTSISIDGKELLKNITMQQDYLFQIACRSLTKEEQRQFTYLANKFSDALREERGVLNE